MGIFLDSAGWAELFLPSTPLLETFARGTLTYLFLFALVRTVHKRQAGAVGMTDLLVVVLLADAAQNAMADDYRSLTDGALLVVTLVGWSVGLEWLGFHVPLIERLVHPPPLALVENGRLNRRNMRHELITESELMTQLREHGVDDISHVKRALMEGDGQLSIVLETGEPIHHRPRGRANGV